MAKVAVVTGAASGIGKACLEALAENGFTVVCSDLSEYGATLVDDMTQRGLSAMFVQTDMARPEEITNLFDRTIEKLGRVDVLVNNAGITKVIDLFDMTIEDWDRIYAVNTRGTFLALQGAARRMSQTGGGSIVNIGSISAKGFKETSNIAYASSKGAVVTMTRIAAARLGALNIRVNAVCPGMTTTEMWSRWVDDRAVQTGTTRQELLAELSLKVPLNRLNEPSDVAAAVMFLATDASRTITGQSLNVDGGTMWD